MHVVPCLLYFTSEAIVPDYCRADPKLDYRSIYDLGRFHPNFTDSFRACNFSYIFKLL